MGKTLFGDSPKLLFSQGAPAPLGSGPAGETCGSCQNCCHVQGHTKWYYKCLKMEKLWTHGAATDIRKKWPACKEFQQTTEN